MMIHVLNWIFTVFGGWEAASAFFVLVSMAIFKPTRPFVFGAVIYSLFF